MGLLSSQQPRIDSSVSSLPPDTSLINSGYVEMGKAGDEHPNVNSSSHSGENISSSPPIAPQTRGLLDTVCEHLLVDYHMSIEKGELLNILGYADENDLITRWDGERTIGAIASKYLRLINDIEF